MKFAQVGYGSDGRGGKDKGGYTYLVNDNVRTNTKLVVLVTHAKSKTIFPTTGKVLTRAELGGQTAMTKVKAPSEKSITEQAEAITGKTGLGLKQGAKLTELGGEKAKWGEAHAPTGKDVLYARGQMLAGKPNMQIGETPKGSISQGPMTKEAIKTFNGEEE